MALCFFYKILKSHSLKLLFSSVLLQKYEVCLIFIATGSDLQILELFLYN